MNNSSSNSKLRDSFGICLLWERSSSFLQQNIAVELKLFIENNKVGVCKKSTLFIIFLKAK